MTSLIGTRFNNETKTFQFKLETTLVDLSNENLLEIVGLRQLAATLHTLIGL